MTVCINGREPKRQVSACAWVLLEQLVLTLRMTIAAVACPRVSATDRHPWSTS